MFAQEYRPIHNNEDAGAAVGERPPALANQGKFSFTVAGTLSANQQKFVLAKWLLTNPRCAVS